MRPEYCNVVAAGEVQNGLTRRRVERRRAMIEAAEQLFLKNGYDATSLAEVVKLSGGSLATLYELFGNKHGLLRAIIEFRKGENVCPGHDTTRDMRQPSDQLVDYAMQLYEHVTSPRIIALKRIVIAEALRDPEFATRFQQEIHEPAVRDLAGYFSLLNQQNSARIDDPIAASELFFAIVMADAHLRVLADGASTRMTEATMRWRLSPLISHFQIS